MANILFVCSANICRSPIAEKLFLQQITTQQQPLNHWTVSSAGTWTKDGHPAAKKAIQAAADWGVDLSGHRSTMLTENIIRSQDLVLVMEASHKEALLYEFPEKSNHIFLLSEMIQQTFDIADPYGKSLKAFKKCAAQLNEIITGGFPRIIQLAQHNQSCTNNS